MSTCRGQGAALDAVLQALSPLLLETGSLFRLRLTINLGLADQ